MFDLATLATEHNLHLPYQLMDVLLNGPANFKIESPNCAFKNEAVSRLELFRTMLYLNGVTPFIIPFIATHSFNDYAGINHRESKIRDADISFRTVRFLSFLPCVYWPTGEG